MMHLCGSSLSPFYERAALTVYLKDAASQIKLGGMPCDMKSEEHFGYNPVGKIPFLILDDGSSLIESQIIAEYLDTVLDGPSLLPADPMAAARVKLFCRLVDLYLATPVVERTWPNRGFTQDEKLKAVNEDLPKAWDYLERFMDDGGYAVGDGLTLADCALIPFLFHLDMFTSHFGDAGVGDRPRLKAWMDTVGRGDVAAESRVRAQKGLEMLRAQQAS